MAQHRQLYDAVEQQRRGEAAGQLHFHRWRALGRVYRRARPCRGVSRQPEYLIEYFKRGQNLTSTTAITARGWGLDPNSEIVLQTYFRPKG